MAITISSRYLFLREEELRLTHAHLEAVKAAKEEEKEARARVRKRPKRRRNFWRSRRNRKRKWSIAESSSLSSRPKVMLKRRPRLRLRFRTPKLNWKMSNRRWQTRVPSYVYVASNRGAFGSEVVKIRMTRRLNPEERLKELSDASVPFNFDKHTVIFSEDAWGLESALHRHFADRRVNLINMRRVLLCHTLRGERRASST
ncbi:GIY-YIG nuclease family protein [Nesterenkonia pannonica]|uniref:GIY-YIG nuclease family protein n=1 Tax=Nesterenkonia pannonica TaxID=1548602 RepID=UPI00216461FE|nr:GIY-YIG nuclease family protein [Nesterenkonia pannonica]